MRVNQGRRMGRGAAGLWLALWLAGAAAGAADAAKGKQVFEQCSPCHRADSTERGVGPGLKGLFKRARLSNGKRVTEANVRAWIEEGGNGMPAFKDLLSRAEKDDLLAYLKTL